MRRRGLLGLVVLLVVLLAFLAEARLAERPPDPRAGAWLEVRFTRPVPGGPRSLRGGPDASLALAIDGARRSVEMAIYDLDLWSVRDALVAAHRRGVDVRLVVEADHLDSAEIADLVAAGVPVVADRLESLMHNKFVVIDGGDVWTGSMNFTVRDGYFNDNSLLRIVSEDVGRAYQAEFNEMFQAGAFGPFSPPGDGSRARLEDGTLVEIYFSPDDRPLTRLLELVSGANERIDFLAFAFTSGELAQAMIASARRGVAVRGVIEAGQAGNLGTQWEVLRDAGLEVRLDGNPDNMHHKLIVVDAAIVVVGSYNLSRSAERFNDENLLVIHSSELARRFLAEGERIYALAR